MSFNWISLGNSANRICSIDNIYDEKYEILKLICARKNQILSFESHFSFVFRGLFPILNYFFFFGSFTYLVLTFVHIRTFIKKKRFKITKQSQFNDYFYYSVL